ncbi:MAG TPA: hypothetical protein V6D15_06605 [Oculatellaceae cyanobacterium]|jgi:hypothetical protein
MTDNYKRLFIWVEGRDDERFINQVICPLLNKKYNYIKIIKYAEETQIWRDNVFRSILQMQAEYIFVADINSAKCITDKKSKLQKLYKNLDANKIIVVSNEIESWYLSGLDESLYKKVGISTYHNNTEQITKEKFCGLIPKKFQKSQIDFMQEILNVFNVEIAQERNKSFKYFFDKYIKESDT